MIQLKRLPEPKILAEKKNVWLKSFLASEKTRPDNSKYAHHTILSTLSSISHHKCYYCESSLKGEQREVDHHVEVACDKSKAYEWDNLFLCCSNCNKKIPDDIISVTDALNPFLHSDAEIEEHIAFESEIIKIKNNSHIGDNTIRKFKLNTDQLDLKRLQFLKKFLLEIEAIKEQQRKEGRDYTTDELERLRSYSYPDHPFSLMFKSMLRKRNII